MHLVNEIKEQLRNRKYKLQPVRRVEIPRPDGGTRNLGVSTVTDRFIQQAIASEMSAKRVMRNLTKFIGIRYRLRMYIWKHWRTPQNRAKNMIKLGIPTWLAWKTAYLHGYAKPASCQDVHMAISNERLTLFGFVSMLDYYTKRCVTC
ncbi:MAG: hypothetical protein HFI75_08485 [Lachnospiraceae bacterium]|nr:hypothetical protein [Lachnospiraceae bacterium]